MHSRARVRRVRRRASAPDVVGFHQSAVADGTASKNADVAGQLSPPSITTDAPSSSSRRTDARSSSAGGKYGRASITSRHTSITRSSVIGQSDELKDADRIVVRVQSDDPLPVPPRRIASVSLRR